MFPTERVAVYMDGCFWHGCPVHFKAPRSHVDYWEAKIGANRRRDVATDAALVEQGWSVVRVWEHEDMTQAALRVAGAVTARRTAHRSGAFV